MIPGLFLLSPSHDDPADTVASYETPASIADSNRDALDTAIAAAHAVQPEISNTNDQSSKGSDSSVSDDSLDTTSDSEISVQLDTSVEERERSLLMAEDAGSDDEKTTSRVRSKHEIIEEDQVVEQPKGILDRDTAIEPLGKVHSISEKAAIVAANVCGDYHVLDEKSLLVFADRAIFGFVSDTFGRIQRPMYTVRFNSEDELKISGVSVGKDVYFVPSSANYVLTQKLRGMRGSDASNWHDEEVDEGEQEFSDDEAEAEYKRRQKKEKEERKKNRGPNASAQKKASATAPTDPEDEPYKPLSRPRNLLHHITQRQNKRSNAPLQPTVQMPSPYTRPPPSVFTTSVLAHPHASSDASQEYDPAQPYFGPYGNLPSPLLHIMGTRHPQLNLPGGSLPAVPVYPQQPLDPDIVTNTPKST